MWRLNKVLIKTPGGLPAGNLEDWLKDPANGVNYYTTNGQLNPVLSGLRPGGLHRLRLVHAAGFMNLELEVPGCEMWLLAADGVYLPAAQVR
jgi:hypothetical protein